METRAGMRIFFIYLFQLDKHILQSTRKYNRLVLEISISEQLKLSRDSWKRIVTVQGVKMGALPGEKSALVSPFHF